MTSYEQEMFSILGIRPTKDINTIERAFARLERKYPQDKAFEKWHEVHYAYQKALEYARRKDAGSDNRYYERPQPAQQRPVKTAKPVQQRPVKVHTETYRKQKPKAAKGRGWRRFIGVVFVIILLAAEGLELFDSFDFSFTWPWSNQAAMSEREATAEIIAYMNEKYPDMYVDEDSFYLYDKAVYSPEEGESVKCGYQAYGADMGLDLTLYYWNDDGQKRSMCLDNYQYQEIIDDLKAYILTTTGWEKGMITLTWADNLIGELLSDGQQFHQYYDGDLRSFFAAESESKDILREYVAQNPQLYSEDEGTDVNGRCIFAYRDDEILTVSDRIKGSGKKDEDTLPVILEEIASEFRLEIECVGIVGEYYDQVAGLDQDWMVRGDALERIYYGFEMDSALPCISVAATSYYRTQDDAYEGKMQFAPAREIAKGLYAITSSEVLQENPQYLTVWEAEASAAASELITEQEETPFASYTCMIPEEQLHAEKESQSEVYKALAESTGQRCVLIWEKEQLGFGAEEAYQIVRSDIYGDEEDNGYLDVCKTADEQFYTYTDALEIEGYIAVRTRIGAEDWRQTITLCK